MVRTLEEHRLVARTAAGGLVPGTRLAALARAVARDLQSAALPELTAVANELGITAFVAVLDAEDVIALVSVEPRHTVAAVRARPGTRHPLHRGAPGIAIQAARPRRNGQPSATSVSATKRSSPLSPATPPVMMK